MKYILLFAGGILTGMAFSRIPHYVDYYANHSLPKPDWEAPKEVFWLNGQRVDREEFESRYFNGGA